MLHKKSTPNGNRADLRRQYKHQRLQMPDTIWRSRSQSICSHLAHWPTFQVSPVIFSFVSCQKEPDLDPLRREFPAKIWALPRCYQDQLQFYMVDEATPLIPNAWGILEPPIENPVILPMPHTLCLVPGLVFDRGGYRLGFGKGYYDRFFATFPHCIKVGVLFWEFLLPSVAPQAWDIKMDYLAHDRSVDPVQN